MAYATGKRIVEMVHENLRPSDIMTRAAFENAILAASAIGASTNCPPHIIAIARHMGVELKIEDWDTIGREIPLLVDCQPAGRFLGEAFHRAGGVPAVMKELLDAGKLRGQAMTVTGKTYAANLENLEAPDREVIRAYDAPMKPHAGFAILSGNIFDSAVMKISVIDAEFRRRYLSEPPGVFNGKVVVFEGPEDYHDRIEDPSLGIDAHTVLVIRNCGPVGYPGSAEVVNMQPPATLIKAGLDTLPTMGDGRQSGTSGSPSILNISPEAAVGGGLALLKSGDPIRIDLNTRKVDVMIPEAELAARARRLEAAGAAEQDPLGGDPAQHGRPARHRRLPGAGDGLPQHPRDARERPSQPLIRISPANTEIGLSHWQGWGKPPSLRQPAAQGRPSPEVDVHASPIARRHGPAAGPGCLPRLCSVRPRPCACRHPDVGAEPARLCRTARRRAAGRAGQGTAGRRHPARPHRAPGGIGRPGPVAPPGSGFRPPPVPG
ncbi:dihydroxy-acid dehydratase [Dankookia sp. P2]|uniref:dihydroxy-acid dehydratase domain-containing protein n=1 Tax=Dankookia sp. P2 TaxID=3423955 RepID=UPI003D67A66D